MADARSIVQSLKAKATEISTNQEFNSNIGNLINGGHMAMSPSNMLYYANPTDGSEWDTKSLVFCSSDGSGKSTFYKGPNDTVNLYHINAVGNDVVFNQITSSGGSVIVASPLSSSSIQIDTCDSWSLCQVENNQIYYLKDGHVWRCNIDGSGKTSFARFGNDVLWRVWNDRIISFPEKGASAVYLSDLNGNNSKSVYSAKANRSIKNAFPVDSSRLLVWEKSASSEDERIVLVDTAKSTETELWADSGGIQRLCASENEVILTSRITDESYRIFSIKFNGSRGDLDFTVPRRGQVRYTSYLNGRIYFGLIDTSAGNQCSLHSVSMTGTDYRDIAD